MKRILVFVLSMVMVLMIMPTYANTGQELVIEKSLKEKLAEYQKEDITDKIGTLQALKIVFGSDKGLELEKGLTRVEGASIYSRVMGYSDSAYLFYTKNKDYKTKFIDIPEWGKTDINYLYKEGKIFGINEKEFGSNNVMTAEQFVTLILRGLGYSDVNGDFKWDKSLDKAVEIGLISREQKDDIEKDSLFTREEMILIAYNALFTECKTTKRYLLQDRSENMRFPVIIKIVYKELNREEITEIGKIVEGKTEEIFKGNKEGLERFSDKLVDLIKESANLLDIKLEGNYYDFNKKHMNNIRLTGIRAFGDNLMINFNNGMLIFMEINRDIISLSNDQEFIKSVIGNIASFELNENKYKLYSIGTAEKIREDGEIDIDLYDNSTDEYKETIETVGLDYTELRMDLRPVKRNIEKYDKNYYMPR